MIGGTFMPKYQTLFLAILALLIGGTPSRANRIYSVNLPIGTGSIEGTIETDGNIGILGAGDIINFNLNISDGVTTSNLIPSNTPLVEVQGVDFSATKSQLLFNFSGTDQAGLFFLKDTHDGICFETGVFPFCTGKSTPGGLEDIFFNFNIVEQIDGLTGTQLEQIPLKLTHILRGGGSCHILRG